MGSYGAPALHGMLTGLNRFARRRTRGAENARQVFFVNWTPITPSGNGFAPAVLLYLCKELRTLLRVSGIQRAYSTFSRCRSGYIPLSCPNALPIRSPVQSR